MYLAANIPQNIYNAKCIWQHSFRRTYIIQNIFSSEHSVGVGADLSCPYPRNCKKIYCVVRWFHSAIMVRGDEEAGAINRSPTPHGVHVGGIAQHKQTVRRWTQTHSLTPIQQDIFIKNVFSCEH